MCVGFLVICYLKGLLFQRYFQPNSIYQGPIPQSYYAFVIKYISILLAFKYLQVLCVWFNYKCTHIFTPFTQYTFLQGTRIEEMITSPFIHFWRGTSGPLLD